jgi:hypothetical protein
MQAIVFSLALCSWRAVGLANDERAGPWQSGDRSRGIDGVTVEVGRRERLVFMRGYFVIGVRSVANPRRPPSSRQLAAKTSTRLKAR